MFAAEIQRTIAPAASKAHHAAARSYDWLGNRYEWLPQGDEMVSFTLDVERLDTPVEKNRRKPANMSAECFLAAWTAAEAECKLADEPILIWLQSNPLAPPPIGRILSQKKPGSTVFRCTDLHPQFGIVFTCAWKIKH